MDSLIILLFILMIIALNVATFVLVKKNKLNIMLSGLIIIVLAPVIGFSSGALLYQTYDFSSGGTGEGAGYGGAFLGLITIGNGLLIFLIGFIRWIIKFLTPKK
ncbi:inner-membrane translocator [Bacillus salitolerans]|uniref:Inner-membrane translocator n=1 Tax=Bacillus salitolerans TaxID=1437434 RepID=A0ABW4LYJ4_9BACI